MPSTPAQLAAGLGGAAIMTFGWLTPFLRPLRSHWGLTRAEAERTRVGDELVPMPLWSWTHAVDVPGAAPADVWPWVAQLGADRAGFYSYEWLENLVGCRIHNADTLHPEWAHRVGTALRMHPDMPPLEIVAARAPDHLVAFGAPDATAQAAGRPWVAASWAFVLEPLGTGCRLVSRFRTACSDHVGTRLAQGPALLEPIGFAMDRRMLLGIRDRVQRGLA